MLTPTQCVFCVVRRQQCVSQVSLSVQLGSRLIAVTLTNQKLIDCLHDVVLAQTGDSVGHKHTPDHEAKSRVFIRPALSTELQSMHACMPSLSFCLQRCNSSPNFHLRASNTFWGNSIVLIYWIASLHIVFPARVFGHSVGTRLSGSLLLL